jgi:hypothetical protein
MASQFGFDDARMHCRYTYPTFAMPAVESNREENIGGL